MKNPRGVLTRQPGCSLGDGFGTNMSRRRAKNRPSMRVTVAVSTVHCYAVLGKWMLSQFREQFHKVAFRTIGLADVLQFAGELNVLVQARTQLPNSSNDAERLIISGSSGSALSRGWQQAVMQRNCVGGRDFARMDAIVPHMSVDTGPP